VGAAGSAGGPFYWRVGPDLVVGDRSCSCELVLPDPVVTVTALAVGGTVQDPSTYEVVNGNHLRRRAGATWHTGNVEVSYTTGAGISPGAAMAVAALAVELAKAVAVPEECQLPERVQTVDRQGVGFAAMLDPQLFLDHGRTGIYLVDLWLTSTRQRPQAVTVTTPSARRYDRRPGA
jgi:hypothetical protein